MDNVKRACHWGHRTWWYLSYNCNKVIWTLHFCNVYVIISFVWFKCECVYLKIAYIWKIQTRKLIYISIWHIFTPSHIFGAKVFRLAMKVKLYMYRSIREILSFFASCSYVVWNYICIQNSIKFHFSYLSSSFGIFCNLIIMVVIIFKDRTFVRFSTSYVHDYMFQKILICIVWGFVIIYSLIIKYLLIS